MNILLVRPDGIGDEILSLPVATALRRAMPGARLSFLSSAYAAPVLAHHPDLDEVLTVTGQETFGELVRLFRNNVDATLFLKPFRRLVTAAWLARTAAERDKFRADAGISQWPIGVRDLMGMVTVRQLMAVIAESQAVVSLSTGPMHVAAALGVPTVSLFDPRRQQSPTRWEPLGAGVVLKPDVPTCEKCIYEACPYWDCLDRITVETVEERITQSLARALPVQVVHV